MRVAIILICTILVIFLISSCKDRNLVDTKENSCERMISQVSMYEFNELSSDMYELLSASQEGDKLKIRIKSDYAIAGGDLYWNGSVRKTYPAQASVNFILKGEEKNNNTESEYCFDIAPLKAYGKIKLYFIDDEETLSLEF